MSERIAYQFNGDHILKFAGMEKLTGEQVADELNRLYNTIAAPAVQGEPVGWVTEDTVDGQAVNGKPRRVWWENNEGVGMPIYTAPQPAEQSIFTVGTDLSDGELSVVVMKHENGISWVIHSEVIQLVDADDYKTWYEDAIARSNEAGFTGMSAAQVIDYQDNEIMQLQASNTRLVEALVAVKARLNGEYDHPALVKQGPLGRFSDDVERIIDSALSAHHKQEVNHDNQ